MFSVCSYYPNAKTMLISSYLEICKKWDICGPCFCSCKVCVHDAKYTVMIVCVFVNLVMFLALWFSLVLCDGVVVYGI